ncbi:MAG: hypothetical protein M0T85_01725 [Dehalococcoidales bacterium]|nr:hypothetical protein [Dehalococcoidales bacterium]
MPPKYLGPPVMVVESSDPSGQQGGLNWGEGPIYRPVPPECPTGYKMGQHGCYPVLGLPGYEAPPQPGTSDMTIEGLWTWVKANPLSAIVVAGGSYYVLKLVKRKVR